MQTTDYTLNVGGRLMSLAQPQVMGIMNLTPDSFFSGSRCEGEAVVRQRARQIVDEGGSIIDVGACSTRPGFTPPTTEEEMRRLREGLTAVRKEVPDAVVSVDTYRADVARMAVEEFGTAIVNDVCGGSPPLTPPDRGRNRMFETVAQLGVPYVLTFNKAEQPLTFFASKVNALRELGQKDIILDPGFGFGKTLDDNYRLLAQLETLKVLELPLLIGVSRKSMIQRVLDVDADHALNGTTVLHTMCLMKGCAQILRVHDVREAVEAVTLYLKTNTERN